MSETYQDLVYSNFPEQVSNMSRLQDVTATAKPLVDRYFEYYNSGDFANAKKIIDDNPELQTMLVNAKTFNQFRDEIIATQRLFKDDIEEYIVSLVKQKGDWNSTTRYTKYNIVYYTVNNSRLPFMSISDNIPIGTLPTQTDYWYPLAIVGEQGQSGLGLTPKGIWSEYVQYYANDLVSYNNALWACREDNIGYFPSDNSNIWYCVLSMNFGYESIKIQNSEIDAILDGSTELTDGSTGTSGESDSITKDEIDNVLNN